MLKLLVIAALAHQITACCLPSSFQFTVLSETHFGRGLRNRARVIMAADAAQGKAAIFAFNEEGQSAFLFADFRTGRAHTYAPPYGCFESAIDENLHRQLAEARCVPPNLLTQSPLQITLAGGLNASLFSGNHTVGGGNFTETVRIDALVSDHCLPILVKVKGHRFNSINIFGDFRTPAYGMFTLPAECNVNSTFVGHRKRGAVTLGYATSPIML